jgi:hypothetical protein
LIVLLLRDAPCNKLRRQHPQRLLARHTAAPPWATTTTITTTTITITITTTTATTATTAAATTYASALSTISFATLNTHPNEAVSDATRFRLTFPSATLIQMILQRMPEH